MVYYLLGDIMKEGKVLVFGLVGESLFMKTDHFHQDGETVIIDEIYKEPGGKGYNQVIAISKMKVKCGFVSCVGNDEFGVKSKLLLNEMKIDDYVIVKDGVHSSFATILTDKKGNNQVSVYPNGAYSLTTMDIDNLEFLFDQYEYILIQLELSQEVTMRIIELSQKHKNHLIINPAPYQAWIKPYLKLAYLITPNFQEAMGIYNMQEKNIYALEKEIKSNFITNTIVTLGEQGALLVTKDSVLKIPLLKKITPIDTTGAGDEFTGTLVAMLAKHQNIASSSIYANYASLQSVQKKYVLPSFATLEDISDLVYVTDEEYQYQGYDNIRPTVRCFIRKDEKYGFLRINGQDIFGKRNHLETSGGGIELGESEEDAVMREIKEETGYTIKNMVYIGRIVHETNLLKRLTFASYYLVDVFENSQKPSLTEYEKSIFNGLEWYHLDELEEKLKKESINKCDLMVHKRELVALSLLKKYLNR